MGRRVCSIVITDYARNANGGSMGDTNGRGTLMCEALARSCLLAFCTSSTPQELELACAIQLAKAAVRGVHARPSAGAREPTNSFFSRALVFGSITTSAPRQSGPYRMRPHQKAGDDACACPVEAQESGVLPYSKMSLVMESWLPCPRPTTLNSKTRYPLPSRKSLIDASSRKLCK
jgi:hypothetical protein